MRFALFSDIHGNLEAFESVLKDIDTIGVDEYLCLGDIVGYGANPEDCVQMVKDSGALTVVGNHDHAAIGRLDISLFNQYARDAVVWTSNHLSESSAEYLSKLSFVEHLTDFVMVHGSLQAPEAFNYVQTVREAQYTFRLMDKNICFCAHSHVPLAFFDTDPMTYSLDEMIYLESDVKTIVNIGSVGQPRDERPEASYAIFDSDKNEIEIRRVEYDIGRAADKIKEAGLPEALSRRLWMGK